MHTHLIVFPKKLAPLDSLYNLIGDDIMARPIKEEYKSEKKWARAIKQAENEASIKKEQSKRSNKNKR